MALSLLCITNEVSKVANREHHGRYRGRQSRAAGAPPLNRVERFPRGSQARTRAPWHRLGADNTSRPTVEVVRDEAPPGSCTMVAGNTAVASRTTRARSEESCVSGSRVPLLTARHLPSRRGSTYGTVASAGFRAFVCNPRAAVVGICAAAARLCVPTAPRVVPAGVRFMALPSKTSDRSCSRSPR